MSPRDAQRAVARIRRLYARHCSNPVVIVADQDGAPEVRVDLRTDRRPVHVQAYHLRIRSDGIDLRAAETDGLRAGLSTLAQLLFAGETQIACMDIDDWPDFARRGVMLDISRDKVPTLATLRGIIDRLAAWKFNELQLYMEHAFVYRAHPTVWRGASPLTGRQIEDLDAYCRERGMTLVPNQNSFGHMERWLCRPRYAPLAETRGPWQTPWGAVRTRPSTLCPVDPRSARLVASLYDALLPHFSADRFNIGCDETWELGQGRSGAACRRRGTGRVYLDFVVRLCRAVRRHRRRVMLWADMLLQFPEIVDALPADIMPMIWGYEVDHPFGRPCSIIASRGLDYYVCPGTSSWCSFAGRTTNALANLRNAAEAGRRHGATGYLITDWGDYGHRQYWPASWVPLVAGACAAWGGGANRSIDAAAEASRHAFDDPTATMGRLWFDAGRVHEASGVALNNRTVLFACMQASLDDPAGVEGLAPGAAERMAAAVDRLAADAKAFRATDTESRLVRDELLATLAVLRHACGRAAVMVGIRQGRGPSRATLRRLGREMNGIIARHRRLWRARNRPGGLRDSLRHYERRRREYERGKAL